MKEQAEIHSNIHVVIECAFHFNISLPCLATRNLVRLAGRYRQMLAAITKMSGKEKEMLKTSTFQSISEKTSKM